MSSSPLLSRFVDEELARATPLIQQVAQDVLNHAHPLPGGRSSQEKQLEHEMMQALTKYKSTLAQRFVDELRERAQAEMARSPAGKGAAGRAPPAKLTLSLLDEVEVSADVELSRVIEAINSVAEFELRELRAFTSALVGDESVSRETNPLHAEVYAHALLAAAKALPVPRIHQLLFMRHASMPLAHAIRMACAAACTRLESQGIEPSMYRTIVQPVGALRRPSAPSPSPFNKPAFEPLLPQITENESASLRINLTELRDSMPVPLDMPQVKTTPPLDQVLLHAEEKLRLLPHGNGPTDHRQTMNEQRQKLLHSAGSRVDQQLIELLSRLFDAILADPRVPPPFQVLLSRLHASALRVALREPEMLDTYSHGVWTFMDRLAFQGRIHGPDNDPATIAVLKHGQTLIEHIAHEPNQDANLYRWAFDRLTAFERRRFEERRQAVAAQIDILRRMTGSMNGPANPVMLDVGSMDTVPADLMNHAMLSLDDAARWLHERQSGQWLHVFLQGHWQVVQLLWRNEEVWLLADLMSRPTTWAVRISALELLYEEQLLETFEPISLVQRAAEKVLNEIATVDDDIPRIIQNTIR